MNRWTTIISKHETWFLLNAFFPTFSPFKKEGGTHNFRRCLFNEWPLCVKRAPSSSYFFVFFGSSWRGLWITHTDPKGGTRSKAAAATTTADIRAPSARSNYLLTRGRRRKALIEDEKTIFTCQLLLFFANDHLLFGEFHCHSRMH